MLACAAARAPGVHSKMLILGSSMQVHERALLTVASVYIVCSCTCIEEPSIRYTSVAYYSVSVYSMYILYLY